MCPRPAKPGSRARMRRCGSACGARRACPPTWSKKSMPTCARRSPTRRSRKDSRTPATSRWTCRRRSLRASCAARSTTISASSRLRGSSRSKKLLQGNSSQALEFIEAESLDHVYDVEPIGLHVDYSQVRVNPVHAARAGERVAAALDDLALALFGEVLHHHHHLFRPHREVHGTTHGGNRIGAAGVPVGKIACRRDHGR